MLKPGMVSIVMPCYNGEDFIKETIDSVLKQTYTNWELLVIDDGSKDDSPSIVNKYASDDSRIKLIKQQNAGSAVARNNGIRYSKGQFLALLDSDDILKPVMSKPIITSKDMQSIDYVGCLTGLYDQSKYGKVYLKEELNSLLDDYAFWISVIALEGVAYGNPKILAKYRVRKNSLTSKKTKLIAKHYKFYRKQLGQRKLQSAYSVAKWGVAGLLKYY